MRRPSRLLDESEAWLRDGLITEDQRRSILARYESDAFDALQTPALLVWLAAILAGIGAVVLIAWNWATLPAAIKLLITGGPMAGLYAAAALAARARRQARSEGFAVMAALFAGGVLFVVDELFHVDSARASTLPLWAAVLAATAALTPSAAAAAVATLVGAWSLLLRGDLPPAPWWFLAIWAALALTVERVANRWVAAAVALLFGVWTFFVVLGTWPDQIAIPAVGAVLAGNWLYTLALAAPERRPAFARATPALVVTVLGLVLLLPSGSHRAMSDWRLAADRIWPGLILAFALIAATLWNAARANAWRSRPAALGGITLAWLITWLVLPAPLRASAVLAWTWTVLFSVAIVHLGAAALRDAAAARDSGQFVVGVASVVVFVVVRIADARSIAVSGMMLIGAALMLLYLRRLWDRGARRGAVS